MDYFGLIIKIISKLSVKPMARCRCVSKLWSSIIRRPNYNQLFPIKSQGPPRLLFAGRDVRGHRRGELLFYSTPQPQNPDKDLEFTCHLSSSIGYSYPRLCSNVGGFVCRQYFGGGHTWGVISNPITGEYVTTPKTSRKGAMSDNKLYFGYDPIEKQFKVMKTTWLPWDSHKYQVLTLRSGNFSWRNIQCCTVHRHEPDDYGICINGVVYYTATTTDKRVIVCFDVRSEKFSFHDINNLDDYLARKICEPLYLIDYKGKLGVVHVHPHYDLFVLWVLEDDKEHKWSEQTYLFPKSTVAAVYSVEMTGSGEIGFFPHYGRNSFYMFYYNLETKTIRKVRVVVPILDWNASGRVHIFSNFVEDVKLL